MYDLPTNAFVIVHLSCKILDVSPAGEVQVDIKPGQAFKPSPANLKKKGGGGGGGYSPPPAASVHSTSQQLTEGQRVNYLSKSTGQWMPCKILKKHPDGAVEVTVNSLLP